MIIALLGKPRAGKSTFAARFVEKNRRKRDRYYKWINRSRVYPIVQNGVKKGDILYIIIDKLLYKKKHYDVVYSTDSTIKNTVHITYQDLGKFRPYPNSLTILEEAGVDLDGRRYKEMDKYCKRYAAMSSHQFNDVVIISQTCDFDKAFRQRCELMLFVEKSFIPGVSSLRRIKYEVDIDETTHGIGDFYYKHKGLAFLYEKICSLRRKYRQAKNPFMRSQWIIRRFWYKYFDSYVDDFDYPMEDPMESDLDKWLHSGNKNPFYEHLMSKRISDNIENEVETDNSSENDE